MLFSFLSFVKQWEQNLWNKRNILKWPNENLLQGSFNSSAALLQATIPSCLFRAETLFKTLIPVFCRKTFFVIYWYPFHLRILAKLPEYDRKSWILEFYQMCRHFVCIYWGCKLWNRSLNQLHFLSVVQLGIRTINAQITAARNKQSLSRVFILRRKYFIYWDKTILYKYILYKDFYICMTIARTISCKNLNEMKLWGYNVSISQIE